MPGHRAADAPHCSIVIASYNRADLLAETLRSLHAHLQQVGAEHTTEVVLIDNNSPRSTAIPNLPHRYHKSKIFPTVKNPASTVELFILTMIGVNIEIPIASCIISYLS